MIKIPDRTFRNTFPGLRKTKNDSDSANINYNSGTTKDSNGLSVPWLIVNDYATIKATKITTKYLKYLVTRLDRAIKMDHSNWIIKKLDTIILNYIHVVYKIKYQHSMNLMLTIEGRKFVLIRHKNELVIHRIFTEETI